MEIEGTGDSLVLIEEPEGSVVQSERVPIKGVVVSGWYPEGADPVFRAMPQIYDDARATRQTFEEWQMIHGPAPSVKVKDNPATAIIVTAACRVRARYTGLT